MDKPTTKKSMPHHVSLPWNELFIEGKVYFPKYEDKNGVKRFNCRVAVYDGKKPDGLYYPFIQIDVTIWGDTAEHASKDIIEKGAYKFYGKLRQWKDKNDTYHTGMLADWFELKKKEVEDFKVI